MLNTCPKRLLVAALVLFAAGCASGPKYTYERTNSSATILACNAPSTIGNDTTSDIIIANIDGLRANFQAALSGKLWLMGKPDAPLYVSPGEHTLILQIAELDNVLTPNSGDSSGIAGTYSSGANPTIKFNFLPNHIYRWAGYLAGGIIHLVLWDVTNGAESRTRALDLVLSGNTNYSDAPRL